MKKSVTKIFQFKNLWDILIQYSFKLKGSKRFSTEDIDKVKICIFDLSRSPVCLYDRNEAATTERKLDKARVSKYTN